MPIQTQRIHSSHSWPKVSGDAPLRTPFRRDITVVRPRSQKSSRFNKKDSEILDQAFNKFRKLDERWKERITLGSLKLHHRFESGDLRILLPFGEVKSGKRGIIVFEPVAPKESLAFTEDITPDSYQSSVFVNVVRFVKSPKRIIPAFVRLEAVDKLHCSWFNDSLYFSTSDGFVSLRVFANRERNICQVPHGSLGVADKRKLINHMIKGTAKVLKGVPSNGEHIKADNGEFSKVRGFLGKFRISLRANNMAVGVPIDLRFRFKFGEVLFGPFNLYPDEDKSFFSAQRHAQNGIMFG
jgi:hypothetical protein